MNLDFRDEALTECLNGIISGLLPHENYDPSAFGLLYPTLKTVLDTKDVKGLYLPIYRIFDKYTSLAVSLPRGKFNINITRERFSKALENNLPDLILEPQMNLSVLMAEEGKSADISIPTVQQDAMGVVYEKSMALYDMCYGMQMSYEDAMSKIVDLKDIVMANMIESGMSAQRAIMSTGYRYGRRSYIGPSGWLKFVQELSREVSEMETNNSGDLICNSVDIATEVEAANIELRTPLCDYGIPQLDDETPLLKHRLAVIVGQENIGKSQIIIHLVAKLIRKGVKPFYGCGEAPPKSVLPKIISSYIYQEYGMFFEAKYIFGELYNSLSPDDKQVVNTAKARVMSSGLVLCNDLAYDTVIPKITHYYNQGCEAFFIDHSQSLRGRGKQDLMQLIDNLAMDCRELKNQYPIYIMVASHPASGLKDLMQKDQLKSVHVSVTARSNNLSTEADELFIITETEFLKAQGLLAWFSYKRRGEKIKPFYIRKHFDVSAFEYDAKFQGADTIDSTTLDGIVKSIASGDDEEEDEELEIIFD